MWLVRQVLVGISLLGCIAIVTLWVRGRWGEETFMLFAPGDRLQAVASTQGRLYVVISNIRFGPERAWTVDHTGGTTGDLDRLVRSIAWPRRRDMQLGPLGATWEPHDALQLPGAWYAAATLPHWVIAGPLLLPPLLAIRHGLRQWRRKRNGWCERCGYDLRGTPHGCPECGAGFMTGG